MCLRKLWDALSLKKQMQDQYVNNGFKWEKLFTINSMQEKVFLILMVLLSTKKDSKRLSWMKNYAQIPLNYKAASEIKTITRSVSPGIWQELISYIDYRWKEID